jgi:hypothetical protein
LRQAIEVGARDLEEGRFDALGTREELSAYLDAIAAGEPE